MGHHLANRGTEAIPERRMTNGDLLMRMRIDTVNELSDAFNRGDVETALARYASDAAMIAQPARLARESAQFRAAIAQFIALNPTLRTQGQSVVEVDDIALYIGRWTLNGTDPSGKAVALGGVSSDVLRRQRDGRWLIAV